jgi:uncharacterized protein YegL
MARKTTTNVFFVLDKSGSMTTVRDATISGFNEYIKTLKNDGNKYKMTLSLFDTKYDSVYEDKSLEDVKDLDSTTYRPDGMTALYDAVCKTLNEKSQVKGKNLVVIMTDGEENSSVEYTEREMKKLIEELEKKGNWTFVFLGANQDAWATAQKFGMSSVNNVVNYNNTSVGAQAAFRSTAKATGFYARSAGMATTDFYDPETKTKIESAK